MSIAFLDLKRQYAEVDAAVAAATRRVLASGRYTLGEEVESFEKEWAAFCGATGAVAVASGTDALSLALVASDSLPKGHRHEVITPGLTSAYTALSILNAGGIPVFVDVNANTYTLDPAKVEQAITPRTRAIVAVHLYGRRAELDAISEIAERRNLIVIEDAAQAHLGTSAKPPAERRSVATCFSFYPTKNLGAYGDAGAVVSNDESFLDRVRELRQGAHAEALLGKREGRNSRMDEIQAAILRAKLPYLERWNQRRAEIAELYTHGLADCPRVICPQVAPAGSNAHHLYVIQHPDRQRLKEHLALRGIETMIHYPYLLHQQPLFSRAEQASLPVTEEIVAGILSLPLYPQLQNDEVQRVIEAIVEYEGQSSP